MYDMYSTYSMLTIISDALYDLLMKMVIEPVPVDNELAVGKMHTSYTVYCIYKCVYY